VVSVPGESRTKTATERGLPLERVTSIAICHGTALHGEHKDREVAEALEKSVAIYEAAGPNFRSAAVQAKKLLSETRGF
jgi:hypothetical protein